MITYLNIRFQESLQEARIQFTCQLSTGRTLVGTSKESILAGNRYNVYQRMYQFIDMNKFCNIFQVIIYIMYSFSYTDIS